MNALKTGIDAESETIPGEDPAELEELTAQYYERFQPQGPDERALLASAIRNDWKLRRLHRVEAQAWDNGMTYALDKEQRFLQEHPDGGPDPHLMARAYEKEDRLLDRCHTRMAGFERNLRAALESLARLRKQGVGLPAAPAAPPPAEENTGTKSISPQPAEPEQIVSESPVPRLHPPASTPSGKPAAPAATPANPAPDRPSTPGSGGPKAVA